MEEICFKLTVLFQRFPVKTTFMHVDNANQLISVLLIELKQLIFSLEYQHLCHLQLV